MEKWSSSVVAEGGFSIKREMNERAEVEDDNEGGEIKQEEEAEEDDNDDASKYSPWEMPGPEELARIREARRARSIDRFRAGAGGTTTGEEEDDDFKKTPKNKKESNIQRSLRAATESKRRMAAAQAKKDEANKSGSGSSTSSASATKGKAQGPIPQRDAGKSPSARGRRGLLLPGAEAKAGKGDKGTPEEEAAAIKQGARPKRGAQRVPKRKFENLLTPAQEQRVNDALRQVDVFNSMEVTHETIEKLNATIATVTGLSHKKFDDTPAGDPRRRREAAKMDAIMCIIGRDGLIPRPIADKKR